MQVMEALKENRIYRLYPADKRDLGKAKRTDSGRGGPLIRYLHLQLGVIPPARFVPVLENEHLIRTHRLI